MSASGQVVLPRYGFGDELASSVIHGIGIVLSIVGLAALVVHAASHGTGSDVLASAVYGISLILLYTASTLYHSIRTESARRVLRTLDHIAIFLLIAGTYTPFTLIALRGTWGWSLFGIVWSLALLGTALELGLLKRYRRLAVLLYVAMGWVGIIAFRPLLAHLQTGGMVLLLAGGAAYTLGVPFYLWRKLPYHHSVWHVFVLAGSVLQFLAVFFYVVPNTAL
ncbi:PAQR family membrane homeostasis protein TrhA [Dyella caseinilytica]|uniref:Hemolysin III family protein n=1 Tax=Dyella caseinilytica TaxID=1849581 RepID=A0ABX7GUV2_9GAMM|nr:hemolysin III family protein [Dyella caseinilytica]QRN52985.1 hemolysin III family protein [Dyella caseinilytica]GGA10574.1 hemolysin III [Dyella caseinilytica]